MKLKHITFAPDLTTYKSIIKMKVNYLELNETELVTVFGDKRALGWKVTEDGWIKLPQQH